MKELAKEYKWSIKILSRRVDELIKIKKFLVGRTRDPEKDPAIIDLNDRLKPLRTMLNDLKDVTREVEHYYDKGWWRSEIYTFNARKSRRRLFAGPVYDAFGYKRSGPSAHERLPQFCDRVITYRETEADCQDVLPGGEENA